MTIASIAANRAALIILDMHACIAGPNGNAQPHARAQNLVAHICELRRKANELGVPVIFVHHRRPHGLRSQGMVSALFRAIADDSDLQPGAPGLAMLPELQVAARDIVIEKQRASAFTGTELDLTLRALAIDTIILTGAWTNLSVESTARYGSDIGYRAIVVSDATASQSEAWHKMALEGGLSAVADIGTTAEVIGALQ